MRGEKYLSLQAARQCIATARLPQMELTGSVASALPGAVAGVLIAVVLWGIGAA